MRHFALLLLALFLLSCGSKGKYDKPIEKLTFQKDSILNIYDNIQDELGEIEVALSELKFKEFNEQIDSLTKLMEAEKDTAKARKLKDEKETHEDKLNKLKLETYNAQRDWLKSNGEKINEKVGEIDEDIADVEGKIKRIPLVSVEQLQLKKFEHFFEVHGSVTTDKNATITAEIPGKIKNILVEVGQKVNVGQTLVILDTEIIQKNIDEVKTAYDLVKTLFEKQEKLWQQKIGSEMQYLEAKNRKESLDQKLETLNAQLDKALIKAPFSGIIDEIFPKEGEMANPMFPVLRMVNLDRVYIVSDVSEDYLGKVKVGSFVRAEFPSLETSFKAKINRIGSYINAKNRTFKVYVDLNNKDNILKPNLLSVLNIRDFEQDSAVVVPSNIIQQDASGADFLFIIEKNSETLKAKKIVVKTGKLYKGETMIKNGLKGDEEIIIKGARSIKGGQEIKI